jgi:O-antigen ligase
VTVLLTMGLMAWAFWRLPRGEGDDEGAGAPAEKPRRRAWAVVIAVLVLATMVAGAVATTSSRWAMLPGQMSTTNPRLIMWRVCAYWLGDAGPLGYGPGTYKLLYPTTPRELLHDLYPRWIVHPHTPGGPVSMWGQVHNDYLQLTFEWGWLGGAAWVVLLVGGLATAVRAAGRAEMPFFDATVAACTAFALGGLMLHALVDFPLQVLALQAYAGVYLGLAWGSGRWPAEHREAATKVEATPAPVVVREGVTQESFKYN